MSETTKTDGLTICQHFIEVLNEMHGRVMKFEVDLLDSDAIYVNAELGTARKDFCTLDEMVQDQVAMAIENTLNKYEYTPDKSKEWVLHSEPNYWTKDGKEVNSPAEAFTIQRMLYLEEKDE